MATGGTAPLIAMANPPHSMLDQDQASTVSSPLSEHEEMDIDMNSSNRSNDDELEKPNNTRVDQPPTLVPHEDSDSNLSDIETNDSEAETERLFNTPRKNNEQANATIVGAKNEQKASPDKVFQRSPSKLQEQIRADHAAESGDDDLSEPQQDDYEEERASVASSEVDSSKAKGRSSKRNTQTQRNKPQESHRISRSTPVGNQSDDSSKSSRKRKRSPLTSRFDPAQASQKRADSTVEPGDDASSLSKTRSEDLAPRNSVGNKSVENSGDDDVVMKDTEADGVTNSVEKPANEPTKIKKSKRISSKKRKDSEEEALVEAQEAEDHAPEDVHAAEEEPIEPEVDEEAEAAHRNEEEMERKRNAFDQLSSIEKHFAILRDRLYEERLAQLNEEEAMLLRDNPTHPEYLAMMQCIDSRRDDKLRVVELEYKFNMDALDRWAVARRSQILSQFYQSVRETREKTLEELGKQWYEIQHERRRNANLIPDFGFHFPKSKAQQKKQAIAHSKETSILAGIAQHHGFPAAPEMKGATQAEVDEDFDAMHRARQSIMGPAHHVQPALNEYGSVPFGRNLGPAGEQFLEQTPWANPKHPSHQVGSRRQSHGAYAGPPAFLSQANPSKQQGGAAWLGNGHANGDSSHKYAMVAGEQETGHARKTAETAKSKREAVVL